MNDIVIRAENLSKQYKIGAVKKQYDTFRDQIAQGFVGLFRRNGHGPEVVGRRSSVGGNDNTIWALKDVSFEVKQGEVLGIIGRNGAGKSTLLKILSRITEPTSGRAKILGRVSSLLEVGTGFHSELTGRENVYLNGAVLGMRRTEINRKFDEIVAFSEVEKFIDTPVKRYSSGMTVRLAFAVAAHLDPDILIVDEVLAVGDSVFQRKCIDRMTKFGRTGQTVLFVSHNLAAVRAMCQRLALLKSGKVVFLGEVEDGIREYQPPPVPGGTVTDLAQVERTTGAQELIFESINFKTAHVPWGEPIQLSLRLRSTQNEKEFRELELGIGIRDKDDNYVIHCSNRFTNTVLNHDTDEGEYIVKIENFLKPNTYYVSLFLRSQEVVQDWLPEIVSFDVADGNPYGFYNTSQIQGATLPRFSFEREIPNETNT